MIMEMKLVKRKQALKVPKELNPLLKVKKRNETSLGSLKSVTLALEISYLI